MKSDANHRAANPSSVLARTSQGGKGAPSLVRDGQSRPMESADVKDLFGSTVDFVRDNRVIFDIGGNKFRLVVHVSYRFKRVLIKFVGTHAEYDRVDPETV